RRIIPLQAERCTVKIHQVRDIEKKLARWQAVVQNAAEQSEGLFVPEITSPMSLMQFAGAVEEVPVRLLLQERGERPALKAVLTHPDFQTSRYAAAIGPEGGWNEAELQLFRFAGFLPVSLGARILRSETAAMALMSALLYEREDGGMGV